MIDTRLKCLKILQAALVQHFETPFKPSSRGRLGKPAPVLDPAEIRRALAQRRSSSRGRLGKPAPVLDPAEIRRALAQRRSSLCMSSSQLRRKGRMGNYTVDIGSGLFKICL